MNWIGKAFVRGVLIALLIIPVVIGAGNVKRLSQTIDDHGAILLTAAVVGALWLGIANIISVSVERWRTGERNQKRGDLQ